MNLDQALQTFIVESRELLEDMESALVNIDSAESREETVNAVFRAAHTIKGSAGLFGLGHIVAFTHVVESVLDKVRDHEVVIDDCMVGLLLECGDHIGAMNDALEAGQLEGDEDMDSRAAPLLTRLYACLGQKPAGASVPAVPGKPQESQVERLGGEHGGQGDFDHWYISLQFGAEVLRNGMDPLSFLRYLCKLGTIEAIVTLDDAMPGADEMDPEACYLGFGIAFKSEADKGEIENVFEFVREDCRIRILPPHSRVADYVRLIDELPDRSGRLGEMLVQYGAVTQHELEQALKLQAAASEPRPIGAILIEEGTVRPAVVEAALQKQSQAKTVKARETQSIRVDSDKLDRLIDLVGELIIATAGSSLVASRTRMAEMQESVSVLGDLVKEVRDSALQLRMVKIGGTFSRFQRVVHDAARETGKDIRLEVSGEDTELDKTVVEKIGDPLTHLVRNAIDHGIERADVRAAAGKPEMGTVRLNAYHDSGSIVIEVSDDGGGLKRDRILAKAIERGLIEPDKIPSDSEIFAQIFEPGFSTADQVTNLSGRGVGMDVVKRNIVAMRGSVDIRSKEGEGTTVTVRLPLTLAIINGFLVGLGKSVFVIPVEMIEECVEYAAEPGHDYADLRGSILPFVRLRDVFKTEQAVVEGRRAKRQSIVVVNHEGRRVGLVVDSLMGEFQTVIKPLGGMFSHVKCISGSSIMGNGEVALILDVPALVRHARASRVDVRVRREGDQIVVTVTDDGVGIDTDRLLNRESWGILGMYERARYFGGELKITGTAGRGTEVALRLPLESSDDE